MNGHGLKHDVVSGLLTAMQDRSKPVKPAALGVIGRDHVAQCFEQSLEADLETFQYRKVALESEAGLPCVVEVAFAYLPYAEELRLMSGVNWSACINTPFRSLGSGHHADGLDALLADQEVDEDSPVGVFVHLACPQAQYTDRGKSAVAIDGTLGEAISKAITAVTSKWAKQRRAEQRAANQIANRREALRRRKRISLKKAAYQVIRDAYMEASTDNTLPAKTRQIYYAARGRILELTGRTSLSQQYFSQTLVPSYMEDHPDETADWDVVYDARGKLIEPHTELRVPLGTLEVRRYLLNVANHAVEQNPEFHFRNVFPTSGPENRFGAIMFVEKEGFNELFERVRLAERYDIAIMSTKGMSVTACRQLADVLCGKQQIPLLVLRDFDKAGFSIVNSLRSDSPRYTYRHEFPVIDLGLRMDDATAWNLEAEAVFYGKSKNGVPRDPRLNLAENGATDDEIEFLAGDYDYQGYSGQRVELNAFSSGQLVEFVEAKFQEHGVGKIVPDSYVLETAYRRAWQTAFVNRQLESIRDEAASTARNVAVPHGLDEKLAKRLETTPALVWDAVLAEIAGADVAGRDTE